MAEANPSLSIVDAKSVFDTLSRNTGGSKADRRNAIELSVIRDSMSQIGSQVRWVPHGRMPADCMTKEDPAKGNLALSDLLIRGTLSLRDENGCLDERALNLSLKSRSRGASLRALKEAATTQGIAETTCVALREGVPNGGDRDVSPQNPRKLSPLFHQLPGNGHAGSAEGPAGPSQLAALEGTGDHPQCGSREGSGSSPPPPPGLEGVRGTKGWRESPPFSTGNGCYPHRQV